jgi:hypothetical protein
MDREATLAALDLMIEPGGAVAFFGDGYVGTPSPDWPALVKRLREKFVPDREAARRWRSDLREGHRSVVARSAFSRTEIYGVVVHRTLTADEIVGMVYSHSDTSPEALGDRRRAFETALRAGLAELSAEGSFAEVVEVTAVIATRPS